MSIRLNGITWNHTRGFLPMVATSQRFGELFPDVDIAWQKRTLAEFGDRPIDELARQFDVLIIDYSFVGEAAEKRLLHPLNDLIPADFLADQAAHSVGPSHASYEYRGQQWALATDAAAPVVSWRPDLMERHHVDLPRTWDDLLQFARTGLVAVPGAPVDCLMHFFMLCCAHGEEPFSSPDRIVSKDVGIASLREVQTLFSLCSPRCLDWNPIGVYEAMTSTNEIAYCPFAFGYSNYARAHFADHRLRFGNLLTFSVGSPLRSPLGGAGLAISQYSKNVDLAISYALFVARPECQQGLYFSSGGQPGYRGAWEDPALNEATDHFFLNTLESLDRTWVRPSYNGFVYFQDRGGQTVRRFLLEGGNERDVLAELETLRQHG